MDVDVIDSMFNKSSYSHVAPFPCFDMLLSCSFQDVFSLVGDDQKFICIFHIGKPGAVLQSLDVSADLHDSQGLEDDDDFCLVKRLLGKVWD